MNLKDSSFGVIVLSALYTGNLELLTGNTLCNWLINDYSMLVVHKGQLADPKTCSG